MRTELRRWLGVAIWIVALAVLGISAVRSLRIGTDLRSFMPPPVTFTITSGVRLTVRRI